VGTVEKTDHSLNGFCVASAYGVGAVHSDGPAGVLIAGETIFVSVPKRMQHMNSSKIFPASIIGDNASATHAPVSFEARFGGLLESIPDALIAVDKAGDIVLANVRADELFGYGRGRLAGRTAETLLPERLRKPNAAEAFAAVPLWGVRRDGSEFPLEIRRGEFPLEAEGFGLLALHDGTGLQKMEKELRDSRAELEALKKEFTAFSHSISHDLRAPVRVMEGFAGMLKKSLGDGISPEAAHAVTRIEENAARMSGLIEGLLDYSSLSWVAVTKRECRPAEIARQAFVNLAVLARGREIDFAVEELPPCRADAALLRRLFDSLLSNALKFTRKQNPAVIRVGCRTEDGEEAYFIADNGVGFDMEYADKLFRIFQRLHGAGEYEGAGVGLAVVQRIARRHGGRVWAEGGVDRGATFYFTLEDSNYGDSA